MGKTPDPGAIERKSRPVYDLLNRGEYKVFTLLTLPHFSTFLRQFKPFTAAASALCGPMGVP